MWYSYSGNGPLASARAEWIHQKFNVLTNLFDRLGLRTNTGKSVIIVCQPRQSVVGYPAEAEERRMTGMEMAYRSRQIQHMWCLECNTELAAGSLKAHRKNIHGVSGSIPNPPPYPPPSRSPQQRHICTRSHSRRHQLKSTSPYRCVIRGGLTTPTFK